MIPKRSQDFVARVQSPERLKLLLLLTVADIRAVGPKIWNGWKAALLRELYHRAFELMSGGIDATAREERVRQAQEAVKKLLPDFTAAEIDSFIAKGYPFYWLSFDAETQSRHARLVREAERSGAPLIVDTRVDIERAVTEVTLYTADHAGLFSRIAGALALAGANIVDAKIHTLSNGMALDTFWVQDREGGAFDQPQKLAKLSVMFENVLIGKLKPHIDLAASASMPSRTRVFTVPPRVLIDNKASSTHTVIEVNGRDRTGLLYEVTRALTQLNLQISSAKISTYGEKVVDVFYVKDLFGHKIDHEKRLARYSRTPGRGAGRSDRVRSSESARKKRYRRGGMIRYSCRFVSLGEITMSKSKLFLPLPIAIVAAALAAAPAGAKSSSSSHSSSSHSTSHTVSPHSLPKSSSNHTGQTVFPKGKSPIAHGCKTDACRRKHPTGFYYNAR